MKTRMMVTNVARDTRLTVRIPPLLHRKVIIPTNTTTDHSIIRMKRPIPIPKTRPSSAMLQGRIWMTIEDCRGGYWIKETNFGF